MDGGSLLSRPVVHPSQNWEFLHPQLKLPRKWVMSCLDPSNGQMLELEQPMARQPGRTSETDAVTAQAGQSDLTPVVEALTQATQALVATTGQLMQLAQEFAGSARGGDGGHDRRGQGGPGGGSPGPGSPPQAQINIWDDDPFSEAVPTSNPRNPSPIAVDVPSNGNPRLQTTIVEPRPAPGRFNPGTSNFRYWVAAEAVARGINFWGALLPSGTTWSTSNPMSVTLVA